MRLHTVLYAKYPTAPKSNTIKIPATAEMTVFSLRRPVETAAVDRRAGSSIFFRCDVPIAKMSAIIWMSTLLKYILY